MSSSKWNKTVIISVLVILLLVGGFNFLIDPFWHYRAGLGSLEYPLKEARYINDGLQRYMDYELLITGSSVSQNFNPSFAEKLWNKKAVKTPYSGTSFHELTDNIRYAIKHNREIKILISSFDTKQIMTEPDYVSYEGIPKYLYDDNPLNDVNYLFNKNVFTSSLAVINYTRSGQRTPDRDEYCRYDTCLPKGKEAVLGSFTRNPISDFYVEKLSEEDKKLISENINANWVKLARDNPEVEFALYYPPYSICEWDALVRTRQLHYSILVMKYAAGLLLQEDNIKLYSFDNRVEMIADLEHYFDTIHYDGEICDLILTMIYEDEGRLTRDNYEAYFDGLEKLYSNMEYDYIFE